MGKLTTIGIPPGGSTGEVLKKKTGTNYDVEWGTGGGGGSGTVTSIATSSPITGGTITTSGTIGITQATTSTDGYLSVTDWNTFNGKQNALTNPVTGTGTSGYVTYWTGTNSVSGSATFVYTPTSQLLVNNAVTASGAIARGINFTPSLTAAANNDVLIGLDIRPSFTSGAFTGVRELGALIGSKNHSLEFYSTSSTQGVLHIKRGFLGSAGDNGDYRLAFFNSGVAYINANTGTGEFQYVVPNTYFQTWYVNGERMRISTSGNLLIGTTTDSGEKLQVTGTAKLTDSATFTKAYSNTSDLGIILSASIPGINLRTPSAGRFSILQNYVNTDVSTFICSSGTGNPSNQAMHFVGSTGDVVIGGWAASTGEKLQVNGTVKIGGNLTIVDAKNIILDITTGTKIGTSTSQKIGFFNATPVVQPSAVTTSQGIADALSSLGLLASSSISTTPDVGGKLYLFNSY